MKHINYKRYAFFLVIILFVQGVVFPLTCYTDNNSSDIIQADLEAFLDTLLESQLSQYHISGATISVVKNGEVLFNKGYGYANANTNKMVVADDTMFHIGSVTKLFTWTAIMQLAEQGKLDLDADITKYIPEIKIDNQFSRPVKIENLLTHTSGFDDRLSNMFLDSKEKIPSLKEALLADSHKRIFAPGEIIAYSNYGAALAGYIVEKVSGMKYEEYIQKNILEPLEMTHTTVYQAVPSELKQYEALGHKYSKGKFTAVYDPLAIYAPAGSICSTSTDMSKFMLANLQDGSYRNGRILKKATVQLMQQQHYTSNERLPGICYGFLEWQRNGKRILWHSGGTAMFKSMLMLIPEDSLGIFVSYNSPDSDQARSELRQAFLDKFYPTAKLDIRPIKDFKQRAKHFTGKYMEGRTAFDSSDKILFWFSRLKSVKENSDGTIQFRDTRYVEVEPLVFHETDGQGVLIFKQDSKGNIIGAYQDYEPHEAYFKLKWYQSVEFQMTIIALCLLIFICTLVIPAYKKGMNTANGKIQFYIKAICCLNIACCLLILFSILIEVFFNPLFPMVGGFPTLFKLALILPVLSIILVPFAIYHMRAEVKRDDMSLGCKIIFSLTIVAAIGFALCLRFWNLFGFIS